MYLSIYRSVYLSASLKLKLFCETSSIFELDNLINAAILRDFFNFWTWQCWKGRNSARLPWQHQKRSNSARLPSNTESWVQSWRPRAIVLRFFHSSCLNYCACPRKSEARSCEVLHLSRKIILANQKIWCSQMQPHISDEHVSCTAPAARNASLQILFKCATPGIVFGHATKPSCLAHCWLAPTLRYF